MDVDIRERYERNFWMLVTDSILLLDASEQNRDPDISNAIARGSILNSLLLPEVAANCCIDSLGLDQRLFKEIDRLTVLGKFEFYLHSRFRGRSIDHGSKPVQGFQELRKLRDRSVHPKKQKVMWTHSADGTATAERQTTSLLGIAINQMDWWSEDGVIAMKATHDFLRYFFVDCCRYSKPKVSGLLCSEDEELKDGDYFVPYLYKRTRDSLVRWGVSIDYFKIGWL